MIVNDWNVVKQSPLPFHFSVQAAEPMALTEAYKLAEGKTVTIYISSRYAFGVVHDSWAKFPGNFQNPMANVFYITKKSLHFWIQLCRLKSLLYTNAEPTHLLLILSLLETQERMQLLAYPFLSTLTTLWFCTLLPLLHSTC